MPNASACDFTQQQVCVYVRLWANNRTATVHYCALINILRKLVSEVDCPKCWAQGNLYLPIKGFKVIPRVHRKTPACKLFLTRTKHIFTYVYLFKVSLCWHISGSSHRIVYLADLKHSWNKPHQKESGRGLCGAVTRHMKPPEPGSVFYVCVCVLVCES